MTSLSGSMINNGSMAQTAEGAQAMNTLPRWQVAAAGDSAIGLAFHHSGGLFVCVCVVLTSQELA